MTTLFAYPLIVFIVMAPIFYMLINKISGVLYIAIFALLFAISVLVGGFIFKHKHTVKFTFFIMILSLITYMISILIGVVTVNYLLAILVGNLIFALGLSFIDYVFYEYKPITIHLYLVAAIVSIVAMYYISQYSDKSGRGDSFSLVYPVVVYCYLQASLISHHVILKLGGAGRPACGP